MEECTGVAAVGDRHGKERGGHGGLWSRGGGGQKSFTQRPKGTASGKHAANGLCVVGAPSWKGQA